MDLSYLLADAQSDLHVRVVYMPVCLFCRVAAQMRTLHSKYFCVVCS